MVAILKFLENQLIAAKWSWKVSAPGIIAGLVVILPEVGKLFDGDVNTVADEKQLVLGLSLMGLGWFGKARDNTGLPPTK